MLTIYIGLEVEPFQNLLRLMYLMVLFKLKME